MGSLLDEVHYTRWWLRGNSLWKTTKQRREKMGMNFNFSRSHLLLLCWCCPKVCSLAIENSIKYFILYTIRLHKLSKCFELVLTSNLTTCLNNARNNVYQLRWLCEDSWLVSSRHFYGKTPESWFLQYWCLADLKASWCSLFSSRSHNTCPCYLVSHLLLYLTTTLKSKRPLVKVVALPQEHSSNRPNYMWESQVRYPCWIKIRLK